MSSDKPDLATAVRALAARERPAWEDHPTPEVLAAHHASELSQVESDRVQEHLARCPECIELLLDLRAFPDFEPSALPAEPGPEVAMAWRRMRERLERERTGGGGSGGASPTRVATAPRAGWWLRGSLAASLVAALACGWWASSLLRRLDLLSQPRLNVAVYDLDPVGSGTRGRQPEVTASPSEALLLLHGASDLSYPDYEVVVHVAAPGSATRFRQRGLLPDLRDEVFTVGVPAGYLEAGRYAVEIYGLGRGEPALVAEYALEIRGP